VLIPAGNATNARAHDMDVGTFWAYQLVPYIVQLACSASYSMWPTTSVGWAYTIIRCPGFGDNVNRRRVHNVIYNEAGVQSLRLS
jgi:hypothetical protein